MALKWFSEAFGSASQGSMFTLRKNFTLLLAAIIMLSAIGGGIVQLLFVPEIATEAIYTNIVTVAAGALGAYLAIKQRVTAAAILLISPLIVSLIFIKSLIPMFIIALLIAIGSAVTFPLPLYLIVSTLILGRFGVELVRVIANTGTQYTDQGAAVVMYASVLLIMMGVTRYLIDTAVKLNRDAVRTAELLRATSQVSQLLSGTLRQEELFNRAVEAIRDRFAFYHVQIFLVDEQRQYANLVASTGEIGQRLLGRGHRLVIGSKSVIGRVTQIGEAVLARADDDDTIHMANEFLPHTHAELALPLIDSDRIIGALDVQSTRANAFSASDVQALQTLAGQLTTAIHNARLFEQQQSSVTQNQQLLLQAQTSLREIQRLNTQMSQRAWDEYLNERDDEVGVKINNEQVATDAEWTHEMISAALHQRVTTRDDGDRAVTAVPIILRGELLGVIEVEGENLRNEDVIEMVQSVAQNLAITLDSVRLLEEVQTAAAQEQRISAIVDRYQSAANVDELMKVTLSELARTLGAEQGTIRLGAYGKQAAPSSTVSMPSEQASPGLSSAALADVQPATNGTVNGVKGVNRSAGSASSNGSDHASRRNGNNQHD